MEIERVVAFEAGSVSLRVLWIGDDLTRMIDLVRYRESGPRQIYAPVQVRVKTRTWDLFVSSYFRDIHCVLFIRHIYYFPFWSLDAFSCQGGETPSLCILLSDHTKSYKVVVSNSHLHSAPPMPFYTPS